MTKEEFLERFYCRIRIEQNQTVRIETEAIERNSQRIIDVSFPKNRTV